MAKMRYAGYMGFLSVPGTDTLTLTMDRLLRDVLPDQRFSLHGYVLHMSNAMALGDSAVFTMAKNVVAGLAEQSGAILVTHGPIAQHILRSRQAAGTADAENLVVSFPEPLDFDADDSLNVAMGGTNTDAAAQQVFITLILHYQAR